MKKSVRLLITGSVQSVFFRQFVQQQAVKQNVKGFIRNLEDGRIEIFVEGDQDNVSSMRELCRKGPPHSIIRAVEEREEPFQDFKEFKVLRF